MVFGGDTTFLEVPYTATLDGLEGQATYQLKHSLVEGVWTFPGSGEDNQTFSPLIGAGLERPSAGSACACPWGRGISDTVRAGKRTACDSAAVGDSTSAVSPVTKNGQETQST